MRFTDVRHVPAPVAETWTPLHDPVVLRAVIRTLLLLLVLPAVIWNRDRQPLHDAVAGTAVVRA